LVFSPWYVLWGQGSGAKSGFCVANFAPSSNARHGPAGDRGAVTRVRLVIAVQSIKPLETPMRQGKPVAPPLHPTSYQFS
jgi:hypothetical protein